MRNRLNTTHSLLYARVYPMPSYACFRRSAFTKSVPGFHTKFGLRFPIRRVPPRLPQFRTRLIRFSGAAWTYGVSDTAFEGVPARITSPARTIVDCFRFEHLIGRETAIEALQDGFREKKVTTGALLRTLEELPSRRLSAALEIGII